MPRNVALLLLLSLIALPTFASDAPWRVSVLASDIASGNQPWEDDAHGGYGLAVAYSVRPNVDIELAAAATSYRNLYTRFWPTVLPSGAEVTLPVAEYRRYTVRPIDLVMTRRFGSGSRVSPYVRAGVRYVGGPENPNELLPGVPPNYVGPSSGTFVPVRSGYGPGFDDRVSAQAGAGLLLHVTPRTAIRVEVNRLLRTDDAPFDPLTRGALGVSWRF